MKKLFLVILFLFSIVFFIRYIQSDDKELSSLEKKSTFSFSDLSLDEAIALKSDKIIFLDFYSDT